MDKRIQSIFNMNAVRCALFCLVVVAVDILFISSRFLFLFSFLCFLQKWYISMCFSVCFLKPCFVVDVWLRRFCQSCAVVFMINSNVSFVVIESVENSSILFWNFFFEIL